MGEDGNRQYVWWKKVRVDLFLKTVGLINAFFHQFYSSLLIFFSIYHQLNIFHFYFISHLFSFNLFLSSLPNRLLRGLINPPCLSLTIPGGCLAVYLPRLILNVDPASLWTCVHHLFPWACVRSTLVALSQGMYDRVESLHKAELCIDILSGLHI